MTSHVQLIHMFPKWKVVSIVVAAFLLVAVSLWVVLGFLSAKENSPEAMYILDLRAARYGWLSDGCPVPIDPEKYLGWSPSETDYVSTVSVTLPDPDLTARSLGIVTNSTYHGLFATKVYANSNTYVITTTGDILLFDAAGKVRLLERGE
ncbi:MAG: hypothetical protein ABSE48_15915 [Verrucomicrobiota bacterium]|jgi:hypothetical protein